MNRIYLSPPEVGAEERRMLLEAFDSNWIAPAGPDVDAFERELAERVGVGHAVALSSGTAALHPHSCLSESARGTMSWSPPSPSWPVRQRWSTSAPTRS